jgi:hypothetical protein
MLTLPLEAAVVGAVEEQPAMATTVAIAPTVASRIFLRDLIVLPFFFLFRDQHALGDADFLL